VTSAILFETLVSLTVQVALLAGVTAWIARQREFRRSSDSCWAAFHVCVLALTCCAFFLPHLRLITWSDLQPSSFHSHAESIVSVAGRIGGWLWAAGAIVIVAVGAAGIMRATRLVRSAVADETMAVSLRRADPTPVSAKEPVEIRILCGGISPFCWQMHRPIIVLPDIVQHFPSGERAAIVRHELAHLRLQHPLHLFLQRVVEAIYWFHPLVWWASRQAAAAREFRCDQFAGSSRAEVAEYLRCLIRLIEAHIKAPGPLPAGLGFLGDESLLSRRANVLADLLDEPPTPVRRWRATALLGVAAVLCAVLWLPINPTASRRADWSPWPTWSATALNATGVVVRDYEVDGHRLRPPWHNQ
jgi:beta-lactamase regulating signal transducer with metallopeptidase domain